MLTFLLVINFVFGGGGENTQTFEGKLEVVKNTKTDTAYYVYYVRGSKIRIDRLNRDKTVEVYDIIDTNSKTIKTVNPKSKVYMIKTSGKGYRPQKGQLEIQKTGSSKEINGYTCYQYRVRNEVDGKEITYWIMKGNYPFFFNLLNTLNLKDNKSSYYLRLSAMQGMLPIQIVERSLLWEKFSTFEILKIEKVKPDNNLFEIPANYVLYKRR